MKDFFLTQSLFTTLGLPQQLTKNLELAGMDTPKPIQEAAIPAMLEGHDILGIAQTGSGKTLAFSLPILAKIINLGDKRRAKSPRALILAPTRELAVQIEEAIRMASKGAHLSTALILGGVSRLTQIKRMSAGVDVLIATPGRLMDLVREKCVDLSHTRYLVLDEADRMLDMGFINDVRKISSLVHKERQTALFSATMPKEIEVLARELLNEPVKIEVAPQGTTAAEIEEMIYSVPTREKKNVLASLLTDPALKTVIVFTRTKHGADGVTRFLEKTGYDVAAIHGNKSQNARQRALKSFRDGSIRILIATDIAARGIDVPGISHVINYDLPDEAESYVHRIGRTGRNNASGIAITLFDESVEKSRLRSVERVIRKRIFRHDVPQQFGPLPEKKEGDFNDKDSSSFSDERRARRPRRARSAAGRDGQAKRNAKPHRKNSRPRALGDDVSAKREGRSEREMHTSFEEKPNREGRANREVRSDRDTRKRFDARPQREGRPSREGKPNREARSERGERPFQRKKPKQKAA